MSSVKSPDKTVIEKGEAEELPPGWTKEVKKRKTGSATKVDRYYTDPVTGYIFHSLKDAQRYIKTGIVGKLASKPKNNNQDENSSKNGSDPSSGKKNVKVSNEREQMSDTFRHKRPLEVPQRASKRLAGINIDAPPQPSPPVSPPEPKTRQATWLAGIKIDAPSPPSPSPPEPKTRQATRLAGIKIDSPPASPPDTRNSRQATRQAGIKIVAPQPPKSPPEPKTREARRLSGTEIVASSPEPKTRQAKRLAGMEIDTSPLSLSLPEPKARPAKQLAGMKIDTSPPSQSLPEPKTRKTTRLAGIKVDSPPPSPPDTRTSRHAAAKRPTPKKIHKKAQVENADMDNNPNHKQEKENSFLFPQESQEKVNKNEFKANENQESHPSLPAVNLGIQMDDDYNKKDELAVVNPPINNPIPQNGYEGGDMKAESSSINFSLNDLWTDPCIEFAVRTLTGGIPFGDLNKANNFGSSPLEMPMEDIWTDPCIEFAVKTLTGAIPIQQDACVHQDYLHHQPNAATSDPPRAKHDYSLPDVGMNFCQTEVLSKHYETGSNSNGNSNINNNQQQQQQQGLTVGNGGLQKSGNMAVAQQVNGSNNGQCSR